MTPTKPHTEMSNAADAATAALKPWSTPLVIVAESRATEGGHTRFTDGTSMGVPYGS